MSSLVTVLIPFYNPAAGFLKDAVESVFKQIRKDWRLLLIDDASTENYLPQIEKYLSDSRVELIRLPRNAGQSQALNKGLELVNTPYMIQLDSDDWFYPHTLTVLLDEASKLPEDIAVVSGNIQYVYEDASGNRIKTAVYKGRKFKNIYDFLLANSSVWPRFYRVSAVRSVGGWPTDDPYEGRVMEDRRILLRLMEKYRFHWVDQMLYIHRKHGKNHTALQTERYAEMTEWTTLDALERLGGRYKPVFAQNAATGWKTVERLIPISPVLPVSSKPQPSSAHPKLDSSVKAPESPANVPESPANAPESPVKASESPTKTPALPITTPEAKPAWQARSATPSVSPLPVPQLQDQPAVPALQPVFAVPAFEAVPVPQYLYINAGPGTGPYTGPGTAPYTGPGTAPYTGPGTAPGTGPGTGLATL
ncbi:glycosyltransferase [Paenibacillus macerans]|uniref:Glycosyltransferase n=1 Tax=Paenibacillus macerans TaxID=44252 RepID=A0A6N8ETJ7_PAEMA|nr:glycosyltransferase [Paenibacillus macerans]MUG22140.1 glycosyltransferase [Paenibacillus macerans]UMV47561.1 glycosyltransferase [Paenibacillus macerans]GBK64522.1 hypothetical protein PbDSM24746_45260 [Paenibacillus macerans]GBK71088.1 hypothetical protein PbJCM17693_47960 [Paenibacillus macerans]